MWQSSRQLDYCIPMQNIPSTALSSTVNGESGRGNGRRASPIAEEQETETVDLERNGSLSPPQVMTTCSTSDLQQQQQQSSGSGSGGMDNSNMFVQHKMVPIPQSSYNILRARRGVIRMLIVVVLTFALCNLPFHARKIWQYWCASKATRARSCVCSKPFTPFQVQGLRGGLEL